jgi:hypothetical protein
MVSKKEWSKILLLVCAVLAPVASVKSMASDTVGDKTQKSGDLPENVGVKSSPRRMRAGDDGGSGSERDSQCDSERDSGSDSGEEQDQESVSLQRVLQLLEHAGAYPVPESSDIASAAASAVPMLAVPTLVERERSFQEFMALPDSALTPEIVNGTNKNGATPFNLALSFHDKQSILRLIECGAQTDTFRLRLLIDACEFEIGWAMLASDMVVSEHASISWEQLRTRYPQDIKRSGLIERIFQNQRKLRGIEAVFSEMESKQAGEYEESGEVEQSGRQAMPDLQELEREQGELEAADSEHNSGQERVTSAAAGHDAQENAVSDEKVSFFPESLAVLTMFFGTGAFIHYFKIDKLVDQYIFRNQP